MDDETVRKINMMEILAGEFPCITEPSEAQLRSWTAEQIRMYYHSGGQLPNEGLVCSQSGIVGECCVADRHCVQVWLLALKAGFGPPRLNKFHIEHRMVGPTEDQPGGGVVQAADPEAHRRTPAGARANQLAATVAGYRMQAIADGIPHRWWHSACMPGQRHPQPICRQAPV